VRTTNCRVRGLGLGLLAALALAAYADQPATDNGPYSNSHQLDIDRATLEQVQGLPVTPAIARRIYDYVELYGRLSSIYDLLKIRGISPEKLEELKPLIYVRPTEYDEGIINNIQRIQRALASEEGPTTSAVEEWQDMLLSPINVNRATIDDLLVLQNVSLVDAVAIARFQKAGGRITGRRDLAGQVPGLSVYGYRSMRNYVGYEEPKAFGFGGNYRTGYDLVPDWDVLAEVTDFDQAIMTMADTSNHLEQTFTSADTAFMNGRLRQEREYRLGLANEASIRHRLRLRLGRYLRLGGWALQNLYEPGTFDGAKGFASVADLGPVRRLFVGDYRLTFGQGLLLDNNSELMARVHDRQQGMFNDLDENPGFGFRGAAADLTLKRLGLVGFYSDADRDAILNPDSTVNYYIISTPRYPTFKNNLKEKDFGGSLRFDLSDLAFVPTGTRLALNGLGIRYNRSFHPDAKYLDVPGDAEVLDDPNYVELDTGKSRLFYGAEFRTVVDNVSLEGEYAMKPARDTSVKWANRYLPFGDAAKAYLVKARAQYDYLYVTALYRHYDVGYDNPYNRGYTEQLRFEDTPLEKTYRVLDPAYAALQDFPMPKAEQGFFIDTRYQISRQVTFTRAYLDVWRNLAWGANNYRFQGEVEYLPIYPLRLRFKEKLQSKELPKVAEATRSVTLESSIRAMVSLANYDYFTAELRHGQVLLTPTMKYADQSSMSGDFVAVQWEHNFSEDFNTEVGVAAWYTRSMSQWIFEDNGIDFLEGQGVKWYAAITDRVTDNLLVYLKFRQKVSDFLHTGLSNAEGLHYEDGSDGILDFVERDDALSVALQVDLLW
jgi:DNA uptake protein ComE-like DNA-binding protein